MDNDVSRRLSLVERGLATLEARIDSRFDSLSRQVNGLSDRFDTAAEWNAYHTNNHHSRGTVVRQGSIIAAISTLLATVATILSKFFL